MNGEVAELLAPFARDGQHDATCTYGCFADHGTLDDLLATVERIVATAKADALREAADEMDNTDDPDAIYVDNGDIDIWLRARADRLSSTPVKEDNK